MVSIRQICFMNYSSCFSIPRSTLHKWFQTVRISPQDSKTYLGYSRFVRCYQHVYQHTSRWQHRHYGVNNETINKFATKSIQLCSNMNLRKAHQNDNEIGVIMAWEEWTPNLTRHSCKVGKPQDSVLQIEDRILYRIWELVGGHSRWRQLLVSEVLTPEFLRSVHNMHQAVILERLKHYLSSENVFTGQQIRLMLKRIDLTLCII